MTTPKIPTQPLRVIDLDSPFIWGVGRDMNDEERANAEKRGRHDNPPMSVLGIARDGSAGVDGKELAELFAAAPETAAEHDRLKVLCGELAEMLTRIKNDGGIERFDQFDEIENLLTKAKEESA